MRIQLRAASVLFGAALVLASSGTASAGSIGLVPNGGCLAYNSSEGTVYFCDSDIRPTGTGYIDPFLRVGRDGAQHDGTPDTYSSGWNTDTKKTDLDDPGANDYDFSQSNALPAGSLGYDTPPIPGVTGQFVLFTVDVNQEGAQNSLSDILSLNHFELYNCASNTYASLSECNGGTSFFNLFNVGDWVNFDYRNHTGSGSGDIDVYIPTTVGFGTDYIALLDGWGCIDPEVKDNKDPFNNTLDCKNEDNAQTGLFRDNDGFQEWISAGAPLQTSSSTTPSSTTTGNPPTGGPSGSAPEPTVMTLLGAGLVLAGRRLRQRMNS